jgi:hypothetical protein
LIIQFRIDELMEIEGRATPGPWYHNGCHGVWQGTSGEDHGAYIASTAAPETDIREIPSWEERTANAKLFATARNTYPQLLRALEIAVEALEKYKNASASVQEIDMAAKEALAEIEKELSS